MLRLFPFSLYFLSFMPLWISIVFIDFLSIIETDTSKITEYISIGCIVLMLILSISIVVRELCRVGKEGSKVQTIRFAREEKAITVEYLLSYVLPLFAFDFTLWKQVVLFLIFFVTLGYLCIRHNYYSANIILELAGYRFYWCIVENSDKVETKQLIISKQRLNNQKGSTIYVLAINNDYGLDVSDKACRNT